MASRTPFKSVILLTVQLHCCWNGGTLSTESIFSGSCLDQPLFFNSAPSIMNSISSPHFLSPSAPVPSPQGTNMLPKEKCLSLGYLAFTPFLKGPGLSLSPTSSQSLTMYLCPHLCHWGDHLSSQALLRLQGECVCDAREPVGAL